MKYLLNVDPRIKLPEEALQKNANIPVYVSFQGQVSEDSASKFVENFEEAEAAAIKSGQTVLPVVINSYGGSIYDALGMVDAMNNCSLTVATIAEGKTMSAGALLLTCGADGYRYIAPNATVMLHIVSSGNYGKLDEIKVSTTEADRLNRTIFKIMSKNCGHHESYFADLLKDVHHHADWFLNAEEAKKHNIVNHIKIPTLTGNITMSVEFG